MKYILLAAIIIGANSAFAGTCETEMGKFKLSAEKQKNICAYFTDTASINEVKACVFKTARIFNKKLTDEEIYATPEEDLNGIMGACSGDAINYSKTSTSSKDSKKEKTKTSETTQ